MFKEQELAIQVAKVYAKPYAQKIKGIIWNLFDSTCEVADNSFDGDETADIVLYFLSTDEQYQHLLETIKFRFPETLGVEKD